MHDFACVISPGNWELDISNISATELDNDQLVKIVFRPGPPEFRTRAFREKTTRKIYWPTVAVPLRMTSQPTAPQEFRYSGF